MSGRLQGNDCTSTWPSPAGMRTGALRHKPGVTSKPGKLRPCGRLCFSTPPRMLLPADIFTQLHSGFTICHEAFHPSEWETNAKPKGAWSKAAELELGLGLCSWRRHFQLSTMPIPLPEERDLIQAINSNFSRGLLEADCCELTQHLPTNQHVQKGGRSWQTPQKWERPPRSYPLLLKPHATKSAISCSRQDLILQYQNTLRVLLWPHKLHSDPRWESCSSWQSHQYKEPPKKRSPWEKVAAPG